MIRSQHNLIWMTSQRIVRSAVVAICCAAALTSAQSADPQPVPTAEIRDVILMLDNGPLHVRLHVSVGKKAPAEARRATMERLLKSLDTDGDGKLSRDEAQRSPLFREKQRQIGRAHV